MTEQRRREKIGVDYDLYNELRDSRHRNRYNGWSIVALFYASLHCVDIAIEKVCRRTNADNHRERNDLLRTLEALKPLNFPYKYLFEYSMRVRYDGEDVTPKEAESAYQKFQQIESAVQQVIANNP